MAASKEDEDLHMRVTLDHLGEPICHHLDPLREMQMSIDRAERDVKTEAGMEGMQPQAKVTIHLNKLPEARR